MNFGINLSFTVKRWVEPSVWAKIVRETLGLDLVQFTYDLLDPWWPDEQNGLLLARSGTRQALLEPPELSCSSHERRHRHQASAWPSQT